MRRVIRANSLSDIVAFAGPLALYGATLVPGVAFWDTGEMQTVPTILGIAHPTGFPAFVLFGWLFVHGIPLGAPAWRLSLFSAFAVAGSAWLLFRFVRGIVASNAVALAAAGAYALGDIVWTRAVRAEVHDLALFFIALALVAADEARRNRRTAPAVVAAFAAGCGLATHPVTALALPSVALLAWPCLAHLRLRGASGALAAFCVPLCSYLYLPLRSAYVERHALDPVASLGLRGGAFWNYDAPASPERFARFVSGASFDPAGAFAALASRPGLGGAVTFVRAALRAEFGYVMLALAGTGFIYLVARERRVAFAFVLLGFGTVAFVSNFRAESDSLRYALPALWMAGVCAGIGARWVTDALVRERTVLAGALATALLAVALWPSAAYAAHDVARERRLDDARAYVALVAERTPDDALVIASWTYATPLAYAAYVAHAFGRRRLVSGWPSDYRSRYALWRRRFAHVYFVLPSGYDATPFGRAVYTTSRWQLVSLRG